MRKSPEELEAGVAEGPEDGLDAARLRGALDIPMLILYTADESGRLTYVSSSSQALLGHPPAALIGKNFLEIIAPEDRAHLQARFAQLAQGVRVPDEYRVLCASGEVRWVLSMSHPCFVDGRFTGVTGVAVDIHTRKQIEQALGQSEERFRNLAELLPEAIFEADNQGRLTYTNRAGFETFGYTVEDLDRGVTLMDMLSPEERARGAQNVARVLAAWREAGAKRSNANEYTAQRRDGSRFPVMIHSTPIVDDAGQVRGIRGIVVDLSEKVGLEDQLRQAQKMEALGRLAGGVAHDVNNLLAPILGYADLLLQRPPAEPEPLAWLQEIRGAALKARDVVGRLLAFTRRQMLELRPVDLGQVVVGLTGMLRSALREDIRLAVEQPVGPLCALADSTQIELALMNLALNAQDAMPHAGELRLAVEPVELDPPAARRADGLEAGAYLQIRVEDTGVGMDPEVQRHLFEPFFTTKAAGQGTGLGLSAVYGIVHKHRGSIRIDSAPGAGTRVFILLPREDSRSGDSTERCEERPRASSGPGRILVVEDEPAVRRLVREILEYGRYEVRLAEDAQAALREMQQPGQAFDLLLCDLILPEMRGQDLVERIREIRPGLAVVLMSGYPEDMTGLSDASMSKYVFISKPFTAHGLLDAVGRALGANTGRNV